jgi:hypothetical protein
MDVLKQTTRGFGVSSDATIVSFLVWFELTLFSFHVPIDTWGGDVVIDVVPGPDGLGNALKSSGRPYTSHTQAQVLNTDCVKAGERIGFSAKIKVDGGGLPDCNPYTWDGATRCPDIMLHTNKAGLREYWRVASVTADTPENGWYVYFFLSSSSFTRFCFAHSFCIAFLL